MNHNNNTSVCKICSKTSHGKGLGGHICTHYALFPVPPKPAIANSQAVENLGDSTHDQAINQHKEKHRKPQSDEDYDVSEDDDSNGDHGHAIEDEIRYPCPYCFRLFKTRQGLGRHKKVHLCNASASNGGKPAKKLRPNLDLNLPAPQGEEEERSAT